MVSLFGPELALALGIGAKAASRENHPTANTAPKGRRQDTMIQAKHVAQAAVPGVGELNALKAELGTYLEEHGMPSQVYITLSSTPHPGSIVGTPNLSEKNGAIFYTFTGKAQHGGESIRVQGNAFLDSRSWAVDDETVRVFAKAKADKAAAYAAKKK